MCIISPTYGYDLEGLSRIDNTVKTREFRGQDKLEEPQLLVSMDSSIGDVLVNRKCGGSVTTEDGVLLRENALHTHPPSQVQAQVDRDLVMYTVK